MTMVRQAQVRGSGEAATRRSMIARAMQGRRQHQRHPVAKTSSDAARRGSLWRWQLWPEEGDDLGSLGPPVGFPRREEGGRSNSVRGGPPGKRGIGSAQGRERAYHAQKFLTRISELKCVLKIDVQDQPGYTKAVTSSAPNPCSCYFLYKIFSGLDLMPLWDKTKPSNDTKYTFSEVEVHAVAAKVVERLLSLRDGMIGGVDVGHLKTNILHVIIVQELVPRGTMSGGSLSRNMSFDKFDMSCQT
uniref:Uncharacterized protein n=1 Tax=Oryza brachyantha TaxID=4533 RepID=J3KVB8_ORYBR